MALIDKDKIRAEIERRIRSIESYPFIEAEVGAYYKRDGRLMAYRDLLSFLDTLPEQPVKGLEEEIEKWMTEDCPPACGSSSYNPFASHWRSDDIQRTAKQFYELGCRRTAVMYDDIEYNRQREEEAEITKGLEEEIRKYLLDHNIINHSEEGWKRYAEQVARHFAEWGAEHLKKKNMAKDCTTCKYGFVDERFGFPMCHHPKYCVDFNFHEEKEEPMKTTGIEERKLPEGLEEAANNYGIDVRLGYPRVMDETDRYIYNAFIAGAEWGATHLKK